MNIQDEILPEHIKSLKQKYGKNSKEDFFIYNSEIFTNDERKLFNYIYQFQIETKTEKHIYSLNTRFLYKEQNKKEPCFMLHGHDKGCTWISWLQLALILFENGKNILLMDLPGFGKSTVDGDKNSFTIKYKNDSHNMVKNMINIFQLKNVHAVGWCGGGANFYRTIDQYPKLFGKNHIFHNVVISQIPTNLVKNLEENNMKIWVSWMLDDGEHSQHCMAYKWLQEKNKQKHKNIKLQLILNKELPCVALWSKQMGKKTDDVYMFLISEGYKNFVIEFLDGNEQKQKQIQYKINHNLIQNQQNNFEDNFTTNYDQILEQSQQEYLQQVYIQNQEQEEIELAIQLSLQIKN